MSASLYSFDTPVQFVGGGRVVTSVIHAGWPVIGVDSGADTALAAGVMPHAVIGDFDSVENRAAIPADRLHHIADQDTTDLEKALLNIAAPLVIANGFMGKRADHTLATFAALHRFVARDIILVGAEDVGFIWRNDFMFEMKKDERVSFFPMAATFGQSSTGLRWPIDGLDFAPDGQIGTSNKALGGEMRAAFSAPMLTFFDPERLEDVINAFNTRAG